VLKGPTAQFMAYRGLPLSSDGVAACYEGLIDGLVADQPTAAVPVLECDVLMDTPDRARELAARTLQFARALGRRRERRCTAAPPEPPWPRDA